MTTPRKYNPGTEAEKMLAAHLRDTDDTRLNCRGLRHAWEVDEDFHVHQVADSKTMHLRRTFRCMRKCGCGVVETFIVTRNNGIERVSRHMVYPEGYQFPGVPRGVKPLHIIQQEMYRRSMERAAKAARGEREAGER